MATIDITQLTDERAILKADFDKLGNNVKQVETDLAQMKANLNAINGALQQVDKLIGMAGGKPVKKEDDKKV